MEEENAGFDGVVAAGQLSGLLQRAVDQHMYGSVVLSDADETVLTFVDGQLVVRPSPESPNPKAGQAALARRLRRLIGDDGYVGPFRAEPVLGEPGLHALHRFDPTDVLEASATGDKQAGTSAVAAAGTRSVRSSQLRDLLLGDATSLEGPKGDETHQSAAPGEDLADDPGNDVAETSEDDTESTVEDSARADPATSSPATSSPAKGLSALERVVRELGS